VEQPYRLAIADHFQLKPLSTLTPQLSICIPAYNRPQWLARALQSIIQHQAETAAIEIVVTDDSTDPECEQVVQQTLSTWSGQWQYVHNQPRLGMAANWNHARHLAKGNYILILHDDDYLLPRAINSILSSITFWGDQHPVFLFGVKIVNEREKRIKQQIPKQEKWLSPAEAVRKLLSHSSWIRFPAIVVQRQAYLSTGDFRTDIGGTADLEIWLRLLGQYGVVSIPQATCAYTVHAKALTQQMFTPTTLSQLVAIFDQATRMNLLPLATIEKCKADFFHQFILAGTYRYIRLRDFQESRIVMQLFDRQELKGLKQSKKWFLLRHFLYGLHWIDKLKTAIVNSLNSNL
jgi:glycosyltransferase involved in cell wall biosynthesis